MTSLVPPPRKADSVELEGWGCLPCGEGEGARELPLQVRQAPPESVQAGLARARAAWEGPG